MKGEVQKVLEIRTYLSFDYPADTATYFFDKKGSIKKTIDSHRQSMECTYVKSYDGKGNIISRSCTGCPKSTRWVNTYNNQGYLVKTEIPFDRQTITFSYDKQNRLIKNVHVDSSNLVGSIFKIETVFKYDNTGNILSKAIYKTHQMGDIPTIQSNEINAFNEHDKIASKEFINYNINGSDTSSSTYTLYKYRTDGNLKLLQITYQNNPNISSTEYLYQNGRLVSEFGKVTYMKKGKLTSHKKERHFDIYGNIIKYVNGTVSQEYSYHYDESGNWIEKITFNQGIARIKTTRELTYFD